MTNARESTDKVDATDAESTEKFVVGWNVNIKTIFVGWGAVRWSAALFEFVTVQRIYRFDIKQDSKQREEEEKAELKTY